MRDGAPYCSRRLRLFEMHSDFSPSVCLSVCACKAPKQQLYDLKVFKRGWWRRIFEKGININEQQTCVTIGDNGSWLLSQKKRKPKTAYDRTECTIRLWSYFSHAVHVLKMGCFGETITEGLTHVSFRLADRGFVSKPCRYVTDWRSEAVYGSSILHSFNFRKAIMAIARANESMNSPLSLRREGIPSFFFSFTSRDLSLSSLLFFSFPKRTIRAYCLI